MRYRRLRSFLLLHLREPPCRAESIAEERKEAEEGQRRLGAQEDLRLQPGDAREVRLLAFFVRATVRLSAGADHRLCCAHGIIVRVVCSFRCKVQRVRGQGAQHRRRRERRLSVGKLHLVEEGLADILRSTRSENSSRSVGREYIGPRWMDVATVLHAVLQLARVHEHEHIQRLVEVVALRRRAVAIAIEQALGDGAAMVDQVHWHVVEEAQGVPPDVVHLRPVPNGMRAAVNCVLQDQECVLLHCRLFVPKHLVRREMRRATLSVAQAQVAVLGTLHAGRAEQERRCSPHRSHGRVLL
mmetsp:Transcript_11203/g.41819  ORF Transcript_11203/g.41819 Transcript_11203/m.41819 type:complete len:299 (-) Transcript_11203:2866-3762(-)